MPHDDRDTVKGAQASVEDFSPSGRDRERPIALLALPNTGTDWFVEVLLRQNPRLRYFREFFNPICNPKYEDVLNQAFGCEMVDNYRMIAKPFCPGDSVFEKTWAKEKYNFTKENYSAFKLEWFVQRFDCFILYRRAEMSLPGSRMPVKAWYDAMYWSLLHNKWTLETDLRMLVDFAQAKGNTIAKRHVAAFVIYYYKLLKDAHRLRVPVLDYEDLMRRSRKDLIPYVQGLPAVLDSTRLANDLVETRRLSYKHFDALKVQGFLKGLVELAIKIGGDSVMALRAGPSNRSSFEFVAGSTCHDVSAPIST